MDTTISGIGERVVAALDAAGYAETTIGQYRKSLRLLEHLARNQEGLYTQALGAEFASLTTNPRTGRFSAQRHSDYGRLVGVVDSYVLTGRVDLSVKRRGGGGGAPQSKEFVTLSAAWSVEMEQRGLAVATRRDYGRAACEYLLYLEASSMTSLAAADGTSVFGFMESLRDRWAESSMWSVVTHFRPFLKFMGRRDLGDALEMVHAKRRHGIVPLLGDDEEQAVVDACTRGQVSARDAAITLLALVTGLRGCDLIALRLKDIDWRGSTIGIVQQKTGNSLTLPLLPAIAERLAEYILNERPDCGNEHVFLRLVAPRIELSNNASIYRVTRRVFKAAGLDRTRVGTRLLRHNAASRLLRAGTPLPTISAVLGHSSPDSTNIYLNTDTERMRTCVLPIPRQGAGR